jgi:hypothetical protein
MRITLPLAILLIGVSAGRGAAQPQLQTTPFYPLEVGARWTYIVTGSKTPGKDDVKTIATIEVERAEPYVRKKPDPDKKKEIDIVNTGFMLKSKSGDNTKEDHVVVLEDGVYKVSVAKTKLTPPICFIKLPPPESGRWEVDSKSGSATIKGTYTVKAAAVTVPAGAFEQAVLVSFTNGKVGDERVEVDCWYVRDKGMVKQRILEKGAERTLQLQKYERTK